jgi:uncharacterized protein
VLRGGRPEPDPAAREPGRGAYLHPRRYCWEQALRRRAFSRAFRSSVTIDPEPLNLP